MKKIIHAQSGHTLFIKDISFDELPDVIKINNADNYTQFYVVKNWSDNGIVFMYLGKGYKQSPKEIVVWYKSGNFWSGYGRNIQEADDAQKYGWMYA